jgi:hypothetical protein
LADIDAKSRSAHVITFNDEDSRRLVFSYIRAGKSLEAMIQCLGARLPATSENDELVCQQLNEDIITLSAVDIFFETTLEAYIKSHAIGSFYVVMKTLGYEDHVVGMTSQNRDRFLVLVRLVNPSLETMSTKDNVASNQGVLLVSKDSSKTKTDDILFLSSIFAIGIGNDSTGMVVCQTALDLAAKLVVAASKHDRFQHIEGSIEEVLGERNAALHTYIHDIPKALNGLLTMVEMEAQIHEFKDLIKEGLSAETLAKPGFIRALGDKNSTLPVLIIFLLSAVWFSTLISRRSDEMKLTHEEVGKWYIYTYSVWANLILSTQVTSSINAAYRASVNVLNASAVPEMPTSSQASRITDALRYTHGMDYKEIRSTKREATRNFLTKKHVKKNLCDSDVYASAKEADEEFNESTKQKNDDPDKHGGAGRGGAGRGGRGSGGDRGRAFGGGGKGRGGGNRGGHQHDNKSNPHDNNNKNNNNNINDSDNNNKSNNNSNPNFNRNANKKFNNRYGGSGFGNARGGRGGGYGGKRFQGAGRGGYFNNNRRDAQAANADAAATTQTQ